MICAESFLGEMDQALSKLRETQLHAIKDVAAVLADSIEHDGIIHAFGTGHSRAFVMEMYNRAGGLACTHMFAIDDLLKRGIRSADDINDASAERDPAVAHQLLEGQDIRRGDAAILISNSGRNGAMIEMALLLKRLGVVLVGVTSLEHSRQVESRHPSGQRLFEVVDYVIDNCAPFGDSVLADDRLPTKVSSVSSVTGAAIAQCLTAEIVRNLLMRNASVPILMSSNVDGADDHNRVLRERYASRH